MRIGSVVFLFAGVCLLLAAQESPPINPAAPMFALSDQFGPKQAKETLKGSNSTVMLFFRSADW